MQQDVIKHDGTEKVVVTEEQLAKIRPYMPEVDSMLDLGRSDFLIKLDALILSYLDSDYEDTPESTMLQHVYDEIYWQTKYGFDDEDDKKDK